MDKLIFVVNGGYVTSRMLSAMRKLSKRQMKTDKTLKLFAVVFGLNYISQALYDKRLKDEIMMLKCEIEKLKQQNGD